MKACELFFVGYKLNYFRPVALNNSNSIFVGTRLNTWLFRVVESVMQLIENSNICIAIDKGHASFKIIAVVQLTFACWFFDVCCVWLVCNCVCSVGLTCILLCNLFPSRNFDFKKSHAWNLRCLKLYCGYCFKYL